MLEFLRHEDAKFDFIVETLHKELQARKTYSDEHKMQFENSVLPSNASAFLARIVKTGKPINPRDDWWPPHYIVRPLVVPHQCLFPRRLYTRIGSSFKNFDKHCARSYALEGGCDNDQEDGVREEVPSRTTKDAAQRIGCSSRNFYLIERTLKKYGRDDCNIKLLKEYLKIPNRETEKYEKLFFKKPREKANEIELYKDHFCMICKIFCCSLHSEKEKTIENPKKRNERNIVSKQFAIKSEEIPWYRLYRCYNKENCFLKKKLICLETDVKMPRDQFKIIRHFLKLNIKNYCFLFLLTHHIAGRLSCYDIGRYVLNKVPDFEMDVQIVQAPLKAQYIFPSRKNFDNEYKCCKHEAGVACQISNCSCIKNFRYCDKFCSCKAHCDKVFPGCKCKNGRCEVGSGCMCLKYKRECDPSICLTCGSERNMNFYHKTLNSTKLCCPNTSVTYGLTPRLLVGLSTICDGFGLFLGEGLLKSGQYIGEYVGELITDKEENDRRMVYQTEHSIYYVYGISKRINIDAFNHGNKMRFINHGILDLENCFAETKLVQGELKVALFAKKNIKLGEELFFDYGNNFIVDWKKPFDRLCTRLKGEKIDPFSKAKKLRSLLAKL